ncbi:MAG TPA: peroxiredoxin-like family protein [Vicinamibacteria bacterium]|nr:peroxiredoxin-like family protein [Vicinamibacteria bacterium]
MTTSHPLVAVGQPAPDFSLPAAQGEGTVSLAAYRGKEPVLLALFRGIYCPFCRRQLTQLDKTAERLRPAGVRTIAVVATDAERARLYFRHRPVRITLGADPDLTTHEAFGVPRMPYTPEIMQAIEEAAEGWVREVGVTAAPGKAHEAVATLDGYQPHPNDTGDMERHQAQLIAQFLVDREGVVRWVSVEGKVGDFPSADELEKLTRTVL